jgi:beta-ribofuranosylaminobenzene 5'-phosphate synthase
MALSFHAALIADNSIDFMQIPPHAHEAMIVPKVHPGNLRAPVAHDALAVERVDVSAPARLHLGFIDLNGDLGRRFGSLGIALESPQTRVSLRRSETLAVDGPGAARARQHLKTLSDRFHRDEHLHLVVEAAIPEHVGLGSGTQLSIATGIAFCRLHGVDADLRLIAYLLSRGERSSIGIATFEQGGVVLDGGRGETKQPPPVLSRLPFPPPWRILLIFDNRQRGLHGAAEIEAFRRLPHFPAATAAHLCRLTLMAALPALAEQNLDRFGGAIAELQRVVGDHFAPVQGGRFTSPGVAEVLTWLESEGVSGVGQSSWGPTGFALIGSQADAERLRQQAERRWPAQTGLSFAISSGRNRGGNVSVMPPRS